MSEIPRAYVTVTDAAGRVLFRRSATAAEIEEAMRVAEEADAEAEASLRRIIAERKEALPTTMAATPEAPPAARFESDGDAPAEFDDTPLEGDEQFDPAVFAGHQEAFDASPFAEPQMHEPPFDNTAFHDAPFDSAAFDELPFDPAAFDEAPFESPQRPLHGGKTGTGAA